MIALWNFRLGLHSNQLQWFSEMGAKLRWSVVKGAFVVWPGLHANTGLSTRVTSYHGFRTLSSNHEPRIWWTETSVITRGAELIDCKFANPDISTDTSSLSNEDIWHVIIGWLPHMIQMVKCEVSLNTFCFQKGNAASGKFNLPSDGEEDGRKMGSIDF